MKKANEIDFVVGMEFKAHVKSKYGEQYNEVVNYKVEKISNFKKRGQKLKIVDTKLNIGCGMWIEEYPFMIEVQ